MAEGSAGDGGKGKGPGAASSGPRGAGGGSAAAPGTFAQPASHAGLQEPVSASPEKARSAAHAAHSAMEGTTHGDSVGVPLKLPRPQGK